MVLIMTLPHERCMFKNRNANSIQRMVPELPWGERWVRLFVKTMNDVRRTSMAKIATISLRARVMKYNIKKSDTRRILKESTSTSFSTQNSLLRIRNELNCLR